MIQKALSPSIWIARGAFCPEPNSVAPAGAGTASALPASARAVLADFAIDA